VGKKKTKVWMGVGLLVAVLGLGSTFASNITLNSSAGTEFGQGVTQTVYCGGDASVTVTPISSFSNTEIIDAVDGIGEEFVQLKYRGTTGSEFQDTTRSAQTFNGQSGWWVTSSGSLVSDISLRNLILNKSSYVFSKRVERTEGRETKVGYYKSGTTTLVNVANPDYVAPVPASTKAASFKLGGVSISGIPSDCAGVDFVLSAYSETGTAKTLISSLSQSVNEIAVYKRTPVGTGESVALFSASRNSAVPTSLVEVTETPTRIDIILLSDIGTPLDSTKLYKLVVETQEHKIGS
jgi:hypothetical protein